MKVKNVALVIALLVPLVLAYQPAEADVSVGISIGLPLFSFPHPPQLAVIPGTYAYYATDVDVDILFYHGRWYRPWGEQWYWARGYNGPWRLAGPRFVPEHLRRLPRDYRHGREYTRIPYYDLNRNWRTWERDRRWEKGYDWWRHARDENRYQRDRSDRRDDGYRNHDRMDVRRDRGSMKQDQMHKKQQRSEGKQNMKPGRKQGDQDRGMRNERRGRD